MIYTSVFVAGFCIMAIELLGGKMLSPYFGSSIYVWGSIITVFMVALALGYLLGGKMSTYKHSMRLYGALFFIPGLLTFLLVEFNDPLIGLAYQIASDPRYGSLLAGLALFLPPTLVLGAISPYSVRIKAQTVETSGHAAGKLYFISTLGSAVGTLVTSFYLVLWMQIDHIMMMIGITLTGTGLSLMIRGKPL
jgi:predicted membrane-bound spermidine synthase